MLLVAKPVKSPVEIGGTKVEVEGDLADYSASIDTYLPKKREQMVNDKGLNWMHATLGAVERAFKKRIPETSSEEIKLSVMYALYDVFRGQEKARIDISLLDTEALESSCSVSFSQKTRKSIEFVFGDSNSFSAFQQFHRPVFIPLVGRYTFSVQSTTLGVRKTYHLFYSLQELEEFASVLRGRERHHPIVIRVPCYQPGAVERIHSSHLPSTEILFRVQLSGEKERCELLGIGITTMFHTDVHSLMYTPRAHLESNPTFEVGRAQRMAVVGNTHAARPAAASGLAHSLTTVIGRLLNSATENGAPQFSWSVSHLNQVVLSHRGLDAYSVGHIGEVLLAVLALRAANGLVTPAAWTNVNLCSSQGLHRLLEKAGSTRVLEALNSLYNTKRGGRLPTVLELITHTAGLPHIGSVDAEVSLEVLEKLLPSEASKLPETGDNEARLAHILQYRTALVAPPGSVVHFSVLGYAVLSKCFANVEQSLKELYAELGMDATRIEQGTPSSPSADTYCVSVGTVSTTNDLCRFTACLEKAANLDPCAHPFLAHAAVPCYLGADYGKDGMHSVCYGGLEGVVLRVRLSDLGIAGAAKAEKVSLNVFYKFGERPEQGSSMLIWIPGLHAGFSLACNRPVLAALFASKKTHKHMGYGKRSEEKLFSVKHFLKAVLRDALRNLAEERGPALELDVRADLAYSVTPQLPPNYSEYAAQCGRVEDLPPEGTGLRALLENALLFKDEGVKFYPLFEAISHIKKHVHEVPVSVSVKLEKILEKMKHLRIKKQKLFKKIAYVLEDAVAGHFVQLVYDPSVKHSVGRELAAVRNLETGGFRTVSFQRRGDVSEHVGIHALPDNVLGVQYHGVLFVSERALGDVLKAFETHRREQIETKVHSTREAVDKKYYMWNTISSESSAPPQQQIAAGAGLVLGAGALGLGVGALAGAALARPYWGYPYAPYPYYPFGAYPYGYGYGYGPYYRGGRGGGRRR